MMNGYNFTERVRKVLALAREESSNLHHEYVGTEHILLGLIDEGDGVAATALQNLSVDLDELKFGIEQIVKRGNARKQTGPDLPYTSRAKKVLELSMLHARDLHHSYVGTEHLLLGLIAEQKGIAAQVLNDKGVTLDTALAEVLRILGTEVPTNSAERSAERVELSQLILPGQTVHKSVTTRIEPPTEILVELIRLAEVVATEYFSSEATSLHAAIALLRRGEGFAIAILDRLNCDREKALHALEEIAQKAESNAAAEQRTKLGADLAEFLREMYEPWKIGLGTLDLLLFVLGNATVAGVFAERGIKAGQVLEEGRRFSG
jgi:ATP-dependent Clp protease ATP-binding subunit ClpA